MSDTRFKSVDAVVMDKGTTIYDDHDAELYRVFTVRCDDRSKCSVAIHPEQVKAVGGIEIGHELFGRVSNWKDLSFGTKEVRKHSDAVMFLSEVWDPNKERSYVEIARRQRVKQSRWDGYLKLNTLKAG